MAATIGQFFPLLFICLHSGCAGDPKRVPLVHVGDQRDAGCASDASALWPDETDVNQDDSDAAPYGFGICSGPRELVCPPTVPTEPSVWTTLPDANRCCRFSRSSAPPFAKFPSRAMCETWVHQRNCRPGWTGFDGCNWWACSEDGRELSRTLGECQVVILLWIQFAPLSSELSDQARCDILRTLHQFLATVRENRKIMIKGHLYTAEPMPERALRAVERARAVERLLANSGVPAESMLTLVENELPMGIEPRAPVVTFDIVPSQLPLLQARRPPPPCSELGDGG